MKAEELRKSILQMAIQGKLVPQDPNDEPASVLLERIRAEKQKLIKEGKIKKDKTDSFIFKGDDNCHYEKIGNEVRNIEDEIPFEIPDSWCWVRFPNIVDFELGKTPDRHTDNYWNNGTIPWFSIADMQDKKIVATTKERISEKAFNEKFNNTFSPKGTLLMSFKLTVGRTSILGVDAVHNEAIISIFPFINQEDITRDYLLNTLGLFVTYVDQTDAIKGATLNSNKMKSMLIAVPPLAEQKRIIAEIKKYEPLLAEYDKLEQEKTKLDSEICDNLKKSILQYAIQGKLVPQDPNDEPASVLLERIRAEKKAKLGKKYVESYIYKGDDNCYYEKVGKNDPVLLDDLPFDIPETWEWSRLGDMFQHNTGKALNSSNTKGSLHPYITTSNLYWDSFKLNHFRTMLFTEEEMEKCSLSRGDLLVCEGGDVGRAAIWDYDIPMCIQNHIHRLRPYSKAEMRFYYYIFFLYKAIGLIGGRGIGIQGLSSNAIDKIIVPVPPINEQRRICMQIAHIFDRIEKDKN